MGGVFPVASFLGVAALLLVLLSLLHGAVAATLPATSASRTLFVLTLLLRVLLKYILLSFILVMVGVVSGFDSSLPEELNISHPKHDDNESCPRIPPKVSPC